MGLEGQCKYASPDGLDAVAVGRIGPNSLFTSSCDEFMCNIQ